MTQGTQDLATYAGEWTASRIIGYLRVGVALSSYATLSFFPMDLPGLSGWVWVLLALYTAFGMLVCFPFPPGSEFRARLGGWAPWVDVFFFIPLVGLTGGVTSVFFFGFFFAIAAASFQGGYRAGRGAALISILGYALISLLLIVFGGGGNPVYLGLRCGMILVIAPFLAQWGESSITQRRRLMLLKEITHISNPRLGIDRTMAKVLERIRAFYGANRCLFLGEDAYGSQITLREAEANDPASAAAEKAISPDLGRLLASLPNDSAILYCDRKSGLRMVDLESGQERAGAVETAARIGALLGTNCYLAIPFTYRLKGGGWIFLARKARFRMEEALFLRQALDHFLPMVDNIRLVETMASEAAEQERRRIALDLHDSIIQPYIALQIGLAAICRKIANDDPSARGDAEKLMQLTMACLSDLQNYVSRLKTGQERGENLAAAVRRFVARFTEIAGIDVELAFDDATPVPARLAPELFQMIVEGLSNARRHTRSPRVLVAITTDAHHITLCVENEGIAEPFTPKSIHQRATGLGGAVRVEMRDNARTVVVVEIPV